MEEEKKINLAARIAELRKLNGLTQEALAERLDVSNKTVSKWERGAGYPEIAHLVRLAEIFAVSVDSLIGGERRGITVAGNIVTDHIKTIEQFPKKGMLVNITSVSRAIGGCVPNTLIDLAVIDPSLPLSAIGRVGDDENGRSAILEMRQKGIDVSGVQISRTAVTSFSDVMSLCGGGKERTFFHHRGANAELCPADIRPDALRCKLFHIGYILLLDELDEPDAEYGTVMARLLKSVQEEGIRTSIDVVSDSRGLFREKVVPSLRYTDNAIMNEIEACGVAELEARDENGTLLTDNLRRAMEFILSCGVSERVIVHCPEAGFILNRSGEFTAVPSLDLPKEFVKGTVGAGDAFCAGCLYGIYHGFSDREILEFASGSAACNLSAEDSVSGMRPEAYIRDLISSVKRQDLRV